MHRFEKLLLTVPAVWLEEVKISEFYTLLPSYFVLKNGSLKVKRKNIYYVLCCVMPNGSFCLVLVRSSLNIIQENGV